MEQGPCSFGLGDESTQIEVKGTETVAIRGACGVDESKRICALQVMIRAGGIQPRLAIIFRGQGQFLRYIDDTTTIVGFTVIGILQITHVI